MKKLTLLLLLSAFSTTSYCTVWQVINEGFTFSPSALTIHEGDSVNFTLAASHDVLEVSQATWNANGSTPLPGGFSTPFGGGMVLPAKLGVGTHYYVCTNHVGSGMKGTITVQSNAGVSTNPGLVNFSAYPNPASTSITINTGSNLIGSHYFISDLSGKQFLNGNLANETTNVDISGLVPGVYLIQLTGQKKYSVKFIKN